MSADHSPQLLDRLRNDVESLARPAGRLVGTAGHEQARVYLEDRLAGTGVLPYTGESYSLEYRVAGTRFDNLVATAPGRERDLPPILLGAHYDTAGALPGADDNAAAVAILLELAERFVASSPRRDIVFALFDAEEPPYFHSESMGSTWFYRHQRRSDFQVALILDLVGHDVRVPGLEDLLFVTGMESSPCLEPCVQKIAGSEGLQVVTALNRYVGDVSDHRAFRLGGTPYLFFSCGRWEHYHQPSDTPDKLNYAKMSALVGLLENLIVELAEVAECVREDCDTIRTDLELMRRHLGGMAQSMGCRLESRDDIDGFAAMLNSLLGI